LIAILSDKDTTRCPCALRNKDRAGFFANTISGERRIIVH
jgi:hypothetical protein